MYRLKWLYQKKYEIELGKQQNFQKNKKKEMIEQELMKIKHKYIILQKQSQNLLFEETII